jgi:exonuclease SbcD
VIRFLHTSDWHLGLELGGHDRLPEQERFLSWLLETCVERGVDALLVAGDVYDVANPSVAAQEAFARFLVGFRRRLPLGTVVVVAGNHDSGARLELPRSFGEALGHIHLRGLVSESIRDHLVPLVDREGAVGAWCVALPFLRAGDLDCRLGEGETPQEAFVRSIRALYASARESVPGAQRGLPLVAMGHLTLAGSNRAGSERVLIGGVESVPATALAEACDYVALGHIHRAQAVGTESVRYSGSPYPIDFDEFRHGHQILDVALEPGVPPRIQTIDVPEFVRFLRFGDPPPVWEAVEAAVEAFDWNAWKDVPRGLQPLVELRYDASAPVADLRARCEALCSGKPFRLVSAPKAVSAPGSPETHRTAAAQLRDRETPEAVFRRHWLSKFQDPPPESALALFRQAVDEVAIEGGAG